MRPIQDLLARIRWDADFGRGRFRIGYWDRVTDRLLYVDLRETMVDADNPSLFALVDEDGAVHEIPLHRIREVWRDDVLIWQRGQPG